MADGILPGLVKGLATTARTLTRHTHTAEYPDVAPALPSRSRGVIALTEENCTSCMLCARECPDWCIYIDSHKEEQPPATPGGRARQRNVLDRFAIDFSSACTAASASRSAPSTRCTGARSSSTPRPTSATCSTRRTGSARGWPPCRRRSPLDPGSAEPAEVAAASRPARAPGAARPPRATPARAAVVEPTPVPPAVDEEGAG